MRGVIVPGKQTLRKSCNSKSAYNNNRWHKVALQVRGSLRCLDKETISWDNKVSQYLRIRELSKHCIHTDASGALKCRELVNHVTKAH